MQEHDRLPVGPDPRFLGQTADLLGLEVLDRLRDAVHLDADVVDPAVLVLLQKAGDRGLGVQGFEQLYFGVLQVHEDHGHPVFRKVLGGAERRKQKKNVYFGSNYGCIRINELFD